MPPAPVRLRQVALVTDDLADASAQVESELGLSDPFVDPGVGEFGLENRVYAAGDCFLEVLTPIDEDSAGARFLERRGNGGYMAIFQFADRAGPRERAADLGIRIVWRADLDDIAGTHLHPADVGGAIVSLDWADPPESWRWAGPSWRGGRPAGVADGGFSSLTIAARDAPAMAARWAAVLGPGARLDGTCVVLDSAGQSLQFVPHGNGSEGIIGCGLRLPMVETRTVDIAGVGFTLDRVPNP